MKAKNIQTRKLGLIEEFIRLNDEDIITKIESLIRQEKKILHERNLKPMSMNEGESNVMKKVTVHWKPRAISHLKK